MKNSPGEKPGASSFKPLWYKTQLLSLNFLTFIKKSPGKPGLIQKYILVCLYCLIQLTLSTNK